MENINKAVANCIKRFRKKLSLSQEDLAAASNIHRTYISQIERGLKSPTLNVLIKISEALNIQLSDLILAMEKDLHGV